MKEAKQLKEILSAIDGRGYKTYKRIEGEYKFDSYQLMIDHVQGDPFASPSKVRIRLPLQIADFQRELYASRIRETALRDYLIRAVYSAIEKYCKGHRGSGKSGMVSIDCGRQEVMERSSLIFGREFIEARISVGLPAKGRQIFGKEAYEMFFSEIPRVVERSLLYKSLDAEKLKRHIETIEDADYIRRNLSARGLVAFVADDSMLPRRTGIDPRPLQKAITFRSPVSMQVKFLTPNRGRITGMGIAEGVTLIVGGGYHGKSTLLDAIQFGIYNHIPGDGREFVVSLDDTVKIRAEDGRRIEKVDISSFINELPLDKDTVRFFTDNASGSTSQAANIIEALESGAKLLLVDEDTSASNFMIRDARMQRLVSKEKEPITPFIDRVGELYANCGVSTILVMGGSGDYFDMADRVIMMDNYMPHDVTDKANSIVGQFKTNRQMEIVQKFGDLTSRKIDTSSINPYRGMKIKIKSRGLNTIEFGKNSIDLSSVEQVADSSQTNFIGDAIYYIAKKYLSSHALKEALEELEKEILDQGIDCVGEAMGGYSNNHAVARKYEIASAINRLRSLRVK